mmetsp:Transcript_47565/g.53213  ORF Transcript_47565/g.53213 Transcript_47565/m.53213 type:complete len:88 (+) Transcript_47565:791-1054(+)
MMYTIKKIALIKKELTIVSLELRSANKNTLEIWCQSFTTAMLNIVIIPFLYELKLFRQYRGANSAFFIKVPTLIAPPQINIPKHTNM